MELALRTEKLLSYLFVLLGDYHRNYQEISLQQTKIFLSYQSIFSLFSSLESCRITDLINNQNFIYEYCDQDTFYLQFKMPDSDVENKCMDTKGVKWGWGSWWWDELGDWD